MTTYIEKQFYDTFGIEPLYKTCIFKYCKNKKEYDCENCNDREWHYPRITPEILLELICILNTVTIPDLVDINIDRLKKTILEECIRALTTIETPTKEEFINNIRTLFKEER